MGLFNKKKAAAKEKQTATENTKDLWYYQNSLIGFNGPVVVLNNTLSVLKNNINSKDYQKQTIGLGSKKAESAFLQGYNYALLMLATSANITRYNEAMITFKDLPKEDREYLNRLGDNN